MRITLLGTSCGVPQIGCHCAVCTSQDPRDRRLRCSALVEEGDTSILLDCSPDFREQMLRLGRDRGLDAVLVTHEHYDHVGGIDDLRPFSYLHDLPLYGEADTGRIQLTADYICTLLTSDIISLPLAGKVALRVSRKRRDG